MNGKPGRTEGENGSDGRSDRALWKLARGGNRKKRKGKARKLSSWKIRKRKRTKESEQIDPDTGNKGTKETGKMVSTCGTAVGAKQGRAKGNKQ